MAIDRRNFLAGIAAGAAAGALWPLGRAAAASQSAGYITTARDKLTGDFLALRLDAAREIRWECPLPARAHGPAVTPDAREALIVARRPGTFAAMIDLDSGDETARIKPAEGRCFYGHGAFDAGGRHLFMTENAFDRGAGVIGVYDTRDDYKRIGELDAGGIGPHQLLMLSDGRTLAVAVGGILTHPDSGRAKLNIDTMRPALQFIDSASGAVVNRVALGSEREWKLSLRHMARLADDRIIIGAQDQMNDGRRLPLVYVAGATDSNLRPLAMPDKTCERLTGYCGSLAFNPMGAMIAVSSPRGGLAALWSSATLDFLGEVDLADGCGLASLPDRPGFLFSSGNGQLRVATVDGADDELTRHPFRQWDNHAVAIEA